MVESPSLLVHPYFKCFACSLLCDLISSPSYGALASAIFASPSVPFTFFRLPCLVRAGVPGDTGASGVGICCVMSHYMLLKSCTPFTLGGSLFPSGKAQLLIFHCYAKYLNRCIIHSLLSPIKSCGGYALLFSGDPCSVPHYSSVGVRWRPSMISTSLTPTNTRNKLMI